MSARPQRPESGKDTANLARMTPEDLFDPDDSPSAHPGESSWAAKNPWRTGAPGYARVGDRWLCRTCLMPVVNGSAHTAHVPEPLSLAGQRTPGISADVEDGTARSTQAPGTPAPSTRYGR